MSELCPRAIQDGVGIPGSPFKFSGEANWREDNSCSYCGSLHPDAFMARLEAGDVSLTPTDKSYKVYIRNVSGEPFKQTYRDCPSDGDRHGPDECTHWVTREISQTKFYFQHLSEKQKNRFIELVNAKTVKLGYPGHFYVLPYFCGRAAS